VSAEEASIIVAAIAAVSAVLAAVISRVHQRESRTDHSSVSQSLAVLSERVKAWHDGNQAEHDVIRSDIKDLRDDFTDHIDK
jgi:Na+-translocating ferredoxin:NAD+ oxidoreductase RnfG subunit